MTQSLIGRPLGPAPTRRGFGLALAGLALTATARGADCGSSEWVFVGSDGPGLRALRFDACSGRLAMVGPVADVAKARWVVKHPSRPLLYVAIDGSGKEGSIAAYALDRTSGALNPLGEVVAGGSGTTYLGLDVASMTLFAAHFGSGSASTIAVGGDGRPGPLVSTLKATGSGPHRRQASPHAHAVALDPTGRHALVADMGADRVFVYDFDRASRVLSPDNGAEPRAFVTPAGSGPRRALFGADGRFVYVLSELTAEVSTMAWDAQRARLAPLQTVAISSPGFQGARSASEMALSQDGRFLYVGDRGEGTLVVYRVDAASGTLTLAQRLSSGGDAPWAWDIHPSGQWMLVANFRSNRLNLFTIDPASGQLTDTGQAIESPAPVSVAFFP